MVCEKQLVGRWLVLALTVLLSPGAVVADDLEAGPFYHQFKLTLAPGHRTEAAGPFFYSELKDTTRLWALPPLFSHTLDEDLDFEEYDLAYPLFGYDRFGKEYRFQIFQLFNFTGGQTQTATNDHRFTLFPVYFQQRSRIPERNYTAVLPFYGTIRNRLFHEQISWIMWPGWVKTSKRDFTTWNTPYPFFHIRQGPGLEGWQFWPLVGHEHKIPTTRTNTWGDAVPVPGHDKFFLLWPFFFNDHTATGTTNPVHQQALIPFYSFTRSPLRDSTTYLWPLGFTRTDDREKKYREWDMPWPLVVFARGEGKTANRIWPFFSQAHNATQDKCWYLWPVYKRDRLRSDPLDRSRTRIFFFLYSDLTEKNTATGAALHRVDFWPFYTARHDLNGNERVQALAILEPILPNNKSIERNYSPLYSLWRSEKNAATGATSRSLLWNLYRRDTTPDTTNASLLFGLLKHRTGPDGSHWRVFYLPVGGTKTPVETPAP